MQTFPITLLGHIAHGSYNLGTNASAIECTHSILSYGNLPCARTRSRISKKLMQKIKPLGSINSNISYLTLQESSELVTVVHYATFLIQSWILRSHLKVIFRINFHHSVKRISVKPQRCKRFV